MFFPLSVFGLGKEKSFALNISKNFSALQVHGYIITADLPSHPYGDLLRITRCDQHLYMYDRHIRNKLLYNTAL